MCVSNRRFKEIFCLFAKNCGKIMKRKNNSLLLVLQTVKEREKERDWEGERDWENILHIESKSVCEKVWNETHELFNVCNTTFIVLAVKIRSY